MKKNVIYMKERLIIEQIARQAGKPVVEVRRDMQMCIDEAWNSTDPAVAARQRELFPQGKPSVEEFIRITALEAAKENETKSFKKFNFS